MNNIQFNKKSNLRIKELVPFIFVCYFCFLIYVATNTQRRFSISLFYTAFPIYLLYLVSIQSFKQFFSIFILFIIVIILLKTNNTLHIDIKTKNQGLVGKHIKKANYGKLDFFNNENNISF